MEIMKVLELGQRALQYNLARDKEELNKTVHAGSSRKKEEDWIAASSRSP